MPDTQTAKGHLKGLYILGAQPYQWIYAAPERERIAELVDIVAPAQTADSIRQNLDLLRDADVIFSGWGCPTLDKELLDAAPNLKIVFYGAGSIRAFTTEEFWGRGIQICSAWGANAVPVSEYTLAAILFGLKSVWQHAALVRQERRFQRLPVAGAYGSTVGLVSFPLTNSVVGMAVAVPLIFGFCLLSAWIPSSRVLDINPRSLIVE